MTEHAHKHVAAPKKEDVVMGQKKMAKADFDAANDKANGELSTALKAESDARHAISELQKCAVASTGTVLSCDASGKGIHAMSVDVGDKDGKPLALTVNDSTACERDGKPAGIVDVAAGDAVEVCCDAKSGLVLHVKATSAKK